MTTMTGAPPLPTGALPPAPLLWDGVHRSLLGLEESHCVTENELRLTYNIETLSTSKPGKSRQISINLIFVPNTQQLASAQVDGIIDADCEALTSAYVHANDVAGLIWAVVRRARQLTPSTR